MNTKNHFPPRIACATFQGRPLTIALSLCLFLAACSGHNTTPSAPRRAVNVAFGAEQRLGQSDNNPSTPFLRYSPDGRLFAIWTEADHRLSSQNTQSTSGKMAPSPMRNTLLAASIDGGQNWSWSNR
jgi:hypothetical protein